MSALRFIQKWTPFATVVGVYLWAVASVGLYRHRETPPGTVVVRIAHWQLETGFRDGVNALAREYEDLHPDVKIVQEAIPEGVYGQWLTTQFMGGTAPDIMEMGMVPGQQLLAFYNRYCVPVSDIAGKPNPYNAGEPLEKTALRQTFKDGMRAGYVSEIQEYMAFPMAQGSTRVFYNKDLLKKLTGSDTPPRDYRAFKKVCESVAARRDEQGRPYSPLVGSNYHFAMWTGPLCETLTYPLIDKADFNRDGYVGSDELFVAVKSGLVSFLNGPIDARARMVRQLADFCQPGFTGLGRDEGVFLFAKGRAVFMTTGTWDARSMREQARGHFSLGVMDYPMPTPGDPEYGEFVRGPRYENPGSGVNFAIYNGGAHPEIAIDFALFLSSRRGNECLNRMAGWIPSIEGAEPDDFFKNFKPTLDGVYANYNVQLGPETWLRDEQLKALFNVGLISVKDYEKTFEAFYKEKGLRDFQEQQRDWRRGLAKNERVVAMCRAKASLAPPGETEKRWENYRRLTVEKLVAPEWYRAIQRQMVERGADRPRTVGPCEYGPETIARVKAKLMANHARSE